MRIPFDNGYEVSIIGASEFVPLPEVGIESPNGGFETIPFVSGEDLMKILTLINDRT
tara:strand:- start:1145 stop:1315 length:171 start_codon:yes stop_codon:yes gene_type:complete